MTMSFKYTTHKEEEFDNWNKKYITTYKRGAIHKVISKTKEECEKVLEDFYNYISLHEDDFCKEGIGEAYYDNIKEKWIGESYIFLNDKEEFDFYKDLYRQFKK